jgi:alpha-L-arabinofuranosidase
LVNDRWYDIQVDVRGDSVYAYIDGQLNIACAKQKSTNMEGVYASTTIDDANKLMYVKVVNVGEGHAPAVINLKNCAAASTGDAAQIIRLASASGNDENTLDNPKAIYPRNAAVTMPNTSTVVFEVPPYSVNIVKIKLK